MRSGMWAGTKHRERMILALLSIGFLPDAPLGRST
jgi:hypothetical protein